MASEVIRLASDTVAGDIVRALGQDGAGVVEGFFDAALVGRLNADFAPFLTEAATPLGRPTGEATRPLPSRIQCAK